MIIYEEEGIKQSFRIILNSGGLIIKTHGTWNETYRDVYSRPYESVEDIRLNEGFLITDFFVGSVHLLFDDGNCAKAVKLLVQMGKNDSELLERYIGTDRQEKNLADIDLNRLENYVDMHRFTKSKRQETIDDTEKNFARKSSSARSTASVAPIMDAPVARESGVEKEAYSIPASQSEAVQPSAGKKYTMFSDELESLIHATLEDGVLEEHEKAALVKRATAEGADLAELEIYINSKLQKRRRDMQQEILKKEQQRNKEHQDALGGVCPNCGRPIPPLTLRCQCGFEFTKSQSSTSMQQLMDKIREIESGIKDNHKRRSAKMEAIKLMPVPNAKEDIIDFLALSLPNSRKKGGIWGTRAGRMAVISGIALVIAFIGFVLGSISNDVGTGGSIGGIILFIIVGYGFMFTYESKSLDIEHNDFIGVWRAKFEQVLMKGRSMRGDLEFQKQLDYYEDRFRKL